MRTCFLLFSTLTLGLLPIALPARSPAAQPSCPITRAVYTAQSDIRVSLRFLQLGPRAPKGWPSELALSIRLPDHGRYDFLFDAGSARFISLISTLPVDAAGWMPPDPDGGVRPLGSLTYYAMDGADHFLEVVPSRDSPAPRAIFMPLLSEALWYRARPRFDLRNTLFVFTRCQVD